ncbi:MAG: YidC/Oxa1 family membrane protein insertase [Planctomycetes bacterium]|nr:YidC/Oxa1 family membrane protein insertase [Planctomycetota bacterium]
MFVAIPSPDVIVSLVASAGQAAGLVLLFLARVLVWRRREQVAVGDRLGARAGRGPRASQRSVAILASLLVVAVGFAVWQHLDAADARAARLTRTLNRPSVEAGRSVGDASLQTLSLSGQLEHSHGVDAAVLAGWLASNERIDLIDVREPEEVEGGFVAGSRHCRYPDIDPASLTVDPTARVVLMCYSGNRSSELVDRYAKQGVEAWFVIGGYEKWIAEGYPLAGRRDAARRELRELPQVAGTDVLLDTPQVEDLVANRNALVIDIRYPKDLEVHALPGVLNLPIRRMPSLDMWPTLAKLPSDRPIVAVCYDRRGAFYAQILGIRLKRLGKDFRGRYTTPYEFLAAPEQERDYVLAWQRHASRSLVDIIADPAVGTIQSLRASVFDGRFWLCVIALAIAARLLLLPFSVRVDRDRIVTQSLQPRIQRLRSQLADDPQRALRATVELQRDAGLRPVRNLVVGIVQTAVFALLFAIVLRSSAGSVERFLWVPFLGDPDPLHALPVLAGLATGALVVQGGKLRGWRALGALGAAAGVGALCLALPAAVVLYLLVSLSWVLAQTSVVRAVLRRRSRPLAVRRATARAAIVPLDEADRLAEPGGKALRLCKLIRAGLPVPRGFVIDLDAAEPVTPVDLVAAFDALGVERVAVRSSGASEDGADRSLAGVYESLLDVERDELPAAFARVRASLRGARARALGAVDGGRLLGSVVVQEMVAATHAGVMFTEDPSCSGAVAIEMVEGLADQLVSGTVTPELFRFGRRTGQPFQQRCAPLDLTPLLELGRRIEARFGGPQDVEWVHDPQRGFRIVQARDVTATVADGASPAARIEAERRRLLKLCERADVGSPALVQDEVAELQPSPTTLSAELMSALWESGGAVDRACRSFGVPYAVRERGQPLYVTAFGRTFRVAAEFRRRSRDTLGALAAFRLTQATDGLESELASLRDEGGRLARLQEAMDVTRLETRDLAEQWSESWSRFVQQTYVTAERVNIAADFFVRSARSRLERRGFDAGVALAVEETVVTRAQVVLRDPERADHAAVQEYLRLYGHRARFDFELAEPRYRERPGHVLALRHRWVEAGHGTDAGRAAITDAAALRRVRRNGGLLRVCVDRARRFQALKEEAKNECLRELAHLRALTVEIGRRFELGELVFDLTHEEIATLVGLRNESADVAALRDRAADRRRDREVFSELAVPTELDAARLETLGAEPGVRVESTERTPGQLCGARVAGEGVVTALARVLETPEEQDRLRPGEILVVRATDPDWMPCFARAGGLVTEVGGWLSHAAIQAREHRLPTIVGAHGARGSIRTGDVVTLHADGAIGVRAELRREPRQPAALPAVLVLEDRELTAHITDVSTSGVRMKIEGRPPARGQTLRLRLSGAETVELVARSNGQPSHVGCELATGDVDLRQLVARAGSHAAQADDADASSRIA